MLDGRAVVQISFDAGNGADNGAGAGKYVCQFYLSLLLFCKLRTRTVFVALRIP